MGWEVEVRDKQKSVVLTTGLALTPLFYSARAVGGPDVAEIGVSGGDEALWAALEWLGNGVRIRNPRGNLVWWGQVVGVSIGLGAASVGRTLEGMANRVIVDYTEEESGVGQVRKSTAWAQDGVSVGVYGRKEERLSLADATLAQAEALRDGTLARRGAPVPTMALGGERGARLLCHGVWRTLNWQLYRNDMGREEHTAAANVEQQLGWATPASTLVGFNGKRLDDGGARLSQVIPGNRLRVSGSARNDGVYTIASAGAGSALEYTATTISFDAEDDIQDDDWNLSFCRMEHMIIAWGAATPANNGAFWVTKEDGHRIEVTPAVIENESAGASVSILQGHALTVSESFVRERAGASLTLSTVGTAIAQGFRLESAAGWTVKSAQLRVRKVGATADNLRVSIHAASGTVPGAQLATTVLAGSAIATTMAWVKFDFGAGLALAAATDYFLVVERTGAAAHHNFYVLGLESDASYARGNLRIFDSGSWVARTPNAHMPFMLASSVETTEQLDAMFADAQFVTGVDRDIASNIATLQWRDGEQTLLTEVERLLESGTASGGGIAAHVTPDGRVVVEAEATANDMRFLLDGEGTLQEPLLGKAEEGVLPVGQWVGLSGAPSQLAEEARFFVESAEYDVVGGRLRLTPRAQAG